MVNENKFPFTSNMSLLIKKSVKYMNLSPEKRIYTLYTSFIYFSFSVLLIFSRSLITGIRF